jgi:hypothetical protein
VNRSRQAKYGAAVHQVEELEAGQEAKAKVEPLLAEFTARLGTLKTANRPSKPMTAKAGEATASLQAAQSKTGAEWLAIEQAREKTQSLADAGDYAGANKLQADFKLKLEAFKAKQAELAPQKQAYEKLRLLVEPRIAAAAKKQCLNLTKQLEEIKKRQGQASAEAQGDHYAQATQHMKEASTKRSSPDHGRITGNTR